MPLHFIVSVLPVTIFLGWYNLFMFSLDFFIFSFEYQTPMLYPATILLRLTFLSSALLQLRKVVKPYKVHAKLERTI